MHGLEGVGGPTHLPHSRGNVTGKNRPRTISSDTENKIPRRMFLAHQSFHKKLM